MARNCFEAFEQVLGPTLVFLRSSSWEMQVLATNATSEASEVTRVRVKLIERQQEIDTFEAPRPRSSVALHLDCYWATDL